MQAKLGWPIDSRLLTDDYFFAGGSSWMTYSRDRDDLGEFLEICQPATGPSSVTESLKSWLASDGDESSLGSVFGHWGAHEVAQGLLIDPTALPEVDRPRCFRVKAGAGGTKSREAPEPTACFLPRAGS